MLTCIEEKIGKLMFKRMWSHGPPRYFRGPSAALVNLMFHVTFRKLFPALYARQPTAGSWPSHLKTSLYGHCVCGPAGHGCTTLVASWFNIDALFTRLICYATNSAFILNVLMAHDIGMT